MMVMLAAVVGDVAKCFQCFVNWLMDICRFANEMPAVTSTHVDTEVTSAAGVDQQVVISSAAETSQAGDDTVTGLVSTTDVVNDERPIDEGKESTDALATRNQRQLLLCDINCYVKYLNIGVFSV